MNYIRNKAILAADRRSALRLALAATLAISVTNAAFAGSATWNTSPATGDWNTATNWTPQTVPNGPSDFATFATSNQTDVSISADTEVGGIVFNADASACTITATAGLSLTLSGFGVANTSGINQTFVTATDASRHFGVITFANSATAGSLTTYTNSGGFNGGKVFLVGNATAGQATFINEAGTAPNTIGGLVEFRDASSADHGSFTNQGSALHAFGGIVVFGNDSRAGHGVFVNDPAQNGKGVAGFVQFNDHSSADNGTFINNGGAAQGVSGSSTTFLGYSSAGNATLIAKGGAGGAFSLIEFTAFTTGGTARLEVFGNGRLDISPHFGALELGSIEGDGVIFLGGNKLIVGSNDLDTTFSGVIRDKGIFAGIGGSLAKVGNGTLVLQHRNTYTGGTSVRRGKLVVDNTGGSGTGTGPVRVEAGKLAGKGVIAGTVIIGTGSGGGATLAPGFLHGTGSPGTLTIENSLKFKSDGTYAMSLNSSNATADEVVANGVTIKAGAQFTFADVGNGQLPTGTVFTAIDNTSALPIAGTFSNLPDGATFTSGSNTYRVSYEGGEGKDLTLTVH